MEKSILYKLPEGEIVKTDKLIINKDNVQHLNVVVVSVERINEVPHFKISTGGANEFRIIGHEQWQQFLTFLKQVDWVCEETSELLVPQKPELIHDTWDRKLHRRGNTMVDTRIKK